MTTTLAHAPRAAAPPLLHALHAALMPDYNRKAAAYWWLMVVLGGAILARTLASLWGLPALDWLPIGAGVAIAMMAGFFPVRIPRSNNSFAAGEIFIFLLLLAHGPAAATLAAAGEGLVGSWRTSKRWTSRIASPAMACVAMTTAGSLLQQTISATRHAGWFGPGLLLVATMLCAVVYFMLNTVLITAVPYLKRNQRLTLRELFGNFGWVGVVYAGSASVACLLFLSYQQAGVGVLMASLPIIAMMLSTLHYYFREQEVSARNAQISLAKDAAVSANLAKTRFLANMSHELRTPLNAVIGAAQLLRLERSDPQRQDYLIDAIQGGGGNLLALIENTLDLARIEAGEMTLHQSDFHIVECIEAALSTAALNANAKGLRLNCVIDPALPAWRHGEAERLRQILLNLLGNAVKFTPRGEIVVRVGAGDAPGAVRVSVSDTGIGIGAESLAHVFEPFRQADEGADRRFGGSGLGLAIVRELVHVMGGQIEVTSTPGAGTRFEFTLPLPAAHGPVPATDSGATRQRVVYFEPHEVSAQALQAQLERLGYEFRRVADAVQLRRALQGWDEGPTPWVLLATEEHAVGDMLESVADLVAPDHVIGMAFDSTHDIEKLRDGAGLTRQIVKPVTRAALVSRIARQATSSSALAAQPPVRVAPPGERRHVLLVDDDPINRSIARSMLEHAGYRVSVAHDGEQALRDLPQLARVDLILMDWQMPGLDGLEVTRRMRAGAAGPMGESVPIVALTANAFVEDRESCLDAGMNDFMTKPLLDVNLRAMAARWTVRPVTAGAASPAAAQPSAVHAGPPAFDPAVLATLPIVADGSEPGFAREMQGLFLEGASRTLARIDRAIGGADAHALLGLMQQLKSSGASVGALEVAALADDQATRLRHGSKPSDRLTAELARAVQRYAQAAGPGAATGLA